MIFSKHNIISRIKDSEKYFIVNLLTGNADILSEKEMKDITNNIFKNRDEFIQKGYLTDSDEEDRLFKQKYLEFLDNRETDEVQLFFVPTYSCNFNCTYCYQHEYSNTNLKLTTDIIDSFFTYIISNFRNKKKYITLFGGEPLLPGDNHKKMIEYFIAQSTKHQLELAIVTNGYHLMEYLPVLKAASIREIQVTLDGTEHVHNSRRTLKNNHGTFKQIVDGIDKALSEKHHVNLRVVVDKENIENLPELARFVIDKGWMTHSYFKTQLGRNYELHHCQINNKNLFSRISLYEQLYQLVIHYPEILDFHKPAYSISKFLFEEGELPLPLFDSCPGTKTEWAFDYTGHIYSCTATVGKTGEELGCFYPEIELYDEKIALWEDRDVLSIKECSDCQLQLACGGGCGTVAKNNTGSQNKPDCRPIKELLELGIGLYFGNQINT